MFCDACIGPAVHRDFPYPNGNRVFYGKIVRASQCIPLAEPSWMTLPFIRTFGICFQIHIPQLRHTPMRDGTRGGGQFIATWEIRICYKP